LTLTEALAHWVRDAERMSGARATLVVVTEEVLAGLVDEQASTSPDVAGVPVALSAASGAGVEFSEMVEIAGPDRVCVYVPADGASSDFPLGLDPSMPVVFVPVSPAGVDAAQLEMYNRLRWYGLGPDEARAGSGS
jgi:hypothetical protein